MKTLLAGRVFESPIATHAVKLWMDENGFLVTIHVDLKVPDGFSVPAEEVPPPLDLETRCRDQASAEECFNSDCDIVLNAQREAMSSVGIDAFTVMSYPIEIRETRQ